MSTLPLSVLCAARRKLVEAMFAVEVLMELTEHSITPAAASLLGELISHPFAPRVPYLLRQLSEHSALDVETIRQRLDQLKAMVL